MPTTTCDVSKGSPISIKEWRCGRHLNRTQRRFAIACSAGILSSPHRWLAAAIFSAFVFAFAPLAAIAQGPRCEANVSSEKKYAVLPIASEFQSGKAQFIRRVLIDQMMFGVREPSQEFDDWYLKYEFPQLTHSIESTDLQLFRRSLIMRHIGRCRKRELHDRLIRLALQSMQEIASGDFHPTIRYYAMLIIGDLNAVEESESRAADPWPDALTVLIEEVERPEQIDKVREAALMGIERHIELEAVPSTSMPIEQKKVLLSSLLCIAGATHAPKGRAEDCHLAMRRLSIQLLAKMATWTSEPEFRPRDSFQALLDGITDNADEPAAVRADARLAREILLRK